MRYENRENGAVWQRVLQLFIIILPLVLSRLNSVPSDFFMLQDVYMSCMPHYVLCLFISPHASVWLLYTALRICTIPIHVTST
jgi:hypothetical protein